MYRYRLFIALLVGMIVGPAYGQETAGRKGDEAAANFGSGLALEGEEAFIGEPLTGQGSGAVFVLSRDAETWTERQSLRASDTGPGDGFGWAVAVDGDALVVGAPARDAATGAAYVFRRDASTGAWVEEARLTAGDGQPGDRLGEAVALSGSYALVGAFWHNSQAGAAYVFRRDATTGVWVEEAKLAAADGAPGDWLGRSVAISGPHAVVGAPFHDEEKGAAYLFRREAATGVWALHRKFPGVVAGGIPESFGEAVALAGDDLVVGAPSHNAVGALYLIRRDPSNENWLRRQTLTTGTLNDNFGRSVAIDGDYVVVGTLGDNDFAGAAYVVERETSTGNWIRQQKLVGSAVESRALFGSRVAISGAYALVWARRDNMGEGAVYVFERDAAGNWTEQAQLVSESGQLEAVVGARVACVGGVAAVFPCAGADLLAFLPVRDLGGPGRLNDIWGWTDPETGHEYALVGRTDGTAFVDVTDPVNPVFLGLLPTHTVSSGWRDIKTYANHAFIVADNAQDHGMQVFDLTELRGVANPPVTFSETAHYATVHSVHNLAINEETGVAYAVGSNRGGTTCGGGLHMIDIQNPTTPTFAGCFSDDGFTHDVQCVLYHGPDAEHQGKEICFASNVDTVTLVDVTDKDAPVQLSRTGYPNVGYTHQGWLTDDHRYFFLDDEGDEFLFNLPTRTLIWDFTDLDDPQLLNEYFAETTNTDHNQYVVGNYLFQSNYTAGLRILDITDVAHPVEVAFFDTSPGDIGGGSWSNYPFFSSGVVIATGITEGLFIVEPTAIQVATETEEVPEAFALAPAYPNPFNPATTLTLTLPQPQHVTVTAYDVLGRAVAVLHRGPLAAGVHRLTFEVAGLPGGTYFVRAVGSTGARTRVVTLVK